MRYFFYGTLLDAAVRRAVLGEAGARLRGLPATLAGYRRVHVPGRTYPTLVAREGGTVAGTVFGPVTPAMAARLARFEGDEYTRAYREVKPRGRAPETVAVFVPASPPRDGLVDWDYDVWRRRYRRRFLAGLDVARRRGARAGS